MPRRPPSVPPDLPVRVVPRQRLLRLCDALDTVIMVVLSAQGRAKDAALVDGVDKQFRRCSLPFDCPAISDALDEVVRLWRSPSSGLTEDLVALALAIDRLRDAVEEVRSNALLEELLFPDPPSLRPQDKSDEQPVIWSLGERQYRVGTGLAVVVTEAEDKALQAFVEREALNERGLIKACGNDPSAPRTLRTLRKRYNGMFAPAIRCPGKKGLGGYRVVVKAATGC